MISNLLGFRNMAAGRTIDLLHYTRFARASMPGFVHVKTLKLLTSSAFKRII